MTSIWIVAHNFDAAAELVSGAKALGTSIGVVLIGDSAVPGADMTVLAPPHSGLLEGYAKPIADYLAAESSQLVLFSNDMQSRLLAGLVAAHLQTSVRNVTGITAQGTDITVTRALYGGLATATDHLDGGVTVLVVGAGALPEPIDQPGAGEVRPLVGEFDMPGCQVIETKAKQVQAVNLASAKKVVGVGRGFAAEEDLSLARELASKIEAEVACSRPIAEGVGWLPVERYLGVSGATIKPDLYIAVGISGQVQHMVGVNRAKTIVAINKDKNAPIFAQADYGIVGDLYEVVPALVQAL